MADPVVCRAVGAEWPKVHLPNGYWLGVDGAQRSQALRPLRTQRSYRCAPFTNHLRMCEKSVCISWNITHLQMHDAMLMSSMLTSSMVVPLNIRKGMEANLSGTQHGVGEPVGLPCCEEYTRVSRVL